MISLVDKCVCLKVKHIEQDEDTRYYFHSGREGCGFGFLRYMKYDCTECGNPFISGRWLRAYHPSHEGTEYQRLFAHLYDLINCPECREYYGYPKIAGSWSLR